MTPERYRDLAIRLAAVAATRPVLMKLECGVGCGAILREYYVPAWPDYAAGQLANRALREGWDSDPAGTIACPSCIQRLAARIAEGGSQT